MFQQLTDIMGDVRGDGEHHSLKEFITPTEPLIQEIASILSRSGDPIATAQDFVHGMVKYERQNGEYWRYPVETLELEKIKEDCDGMAVLLCSILRNYLSAEEVYVAVGKINSHGHAWVVANWKIIESTASSKQKINGNKYNPAVFFNDQYAYAEPNGFGYLLVGKYYFRTN